QFRNQHRGFGIVLSLQLATVRFYDTAGAIQTKAIMSLSDVAEWFPPPIVRIRRKGCFRFVKGEQEPSVADSGFCNQGAFPAMVLEGVGKKLSKYFLEQLRIDVQRTLQILYFPRDLVVFFWKITFDLGAHVGQEFCGRISNHIRFDVSDCS